MRIDMDESVEADNVFEQLLYNTVRIECFDQKSEFLFVRNSQEWPFSDFR